MLTDRVQCVIVLYRTTLDSSETYQTLVRSALQFPSLAARLSLLIYDNSPESQAIQALPNLFQEVRYQHDPSNGGLASAYNSALATAESSECAWLWIFDQDTELRPELIAAAFEMIDNSPASHVCAIVPRLVQDGVLLSPVAVRRFWYERIPVNFHGIYAGRLTALNSCTCLRVNAVRAIGGFPSHYWLDFLDYAIFHRLSEKGDLVLVLDVTLQHHLSVNNLRNESDHRRFANVLAAEWQFVRETGWGGGSLVHRMRLLKRALRTLITQREPAYALQLIRWSLR